MRSFCTELLLNYKMTTAYGLTLQKLGRLKTAPPQKKVTKGRYHNLTKTNILNCLKNLDFNQYLLKPTMFGTVTLVIPKSPV